MKPPFRMRFAGVVWINLCFVISGLAVALAAVAPCAVALDYLGVQFPDWLAAVSGGAVLLAGMAGAGWGACKARAWPGCESVSPTFLVLGFIAGAWLGGQAEGLALPPAKAALLAYPSLATAPDGDLAEGILPLLGETAGILAATFIQRPPRARA